MGSQWGAASQTAEAGMVMPMIVAHRGGAGLRPENTLAACAHALALGADGLEIDVRLTRDGEVVVFHDPVLDARHVRGEDGTLLADEPTHVRDLSVSELKMFDVGYPRAWAQECGAPSVPGEQIPTLGELLSFPDVLHREPLLLIELKTDFHTDAQLDPKELTNAVLDVVGARVESGRIRLMSFDWRCVVHAASRIGAKNCVFLSTPEGENVSVDIAPWFAGHAPSRYGGSTVKAVRALGGRHWGPHHRQLNPQVVIEAHEDRIEIAAWTVNEPRHLIRMQAYGVDCLITDFPDRALAMRETANAGVNSS